jgi:hypothetical protein
MKSIDWDRIREYHTAAQAATRDAILERKGIRHRISEGTERGRSDPRTFGRGDFARSLSKIRRGRLEEEPNP